MTDGQACRISLTIFKKVLTRSAIGLAAMGAAVVLWLVGGNAFAHYRERQEEQAWAQSFGTLQDLLKRYPKTHTNETARRLEHLARPLGLDLTPRKPDALVARNVSSAKVSETLAERLRRAASRYLTEQLEKPGASIAPPPEELGRFFATQAQDLDALQAELLASVPRWDFDASSLSGSQAIPNVSAVLSLQRILLAEALRESVSGDAMTASRTLETSWKLNEPLREIPESLCQIMALAIARLQIGAVRKLQVDPGLWRERLSEHDFKQSRLDTELLFEWPSQGNLHRLDEVESRSESNGLKRLQSFLLRPYRNVVWLEFVEGLRLEYVGIRNSPLSDREIPERKVDSKGGATAILLSISVPNTLEMFRRIDRFLLDAELTDKILQARQLRLRNGGKWPPAIPGIEVTRFPGARWIYSVSPEGTMTLSLSKKPNWNQSGFHLPVRFEST